MNSTNKDYIKTSVKKKKPLVAIFFFGGSWSFSACLSAGRKVPGRHFSTKKIVDLFFEICYIWGMIEENTQTLENRGNSDVVRSGGKLATATKKNDERQLEVTKIDPESLQDLNSLMAGKIP